MSQRKALIASILLTLVLAFSAIGIRAAIVDSPGDSSEAKGSLPLVVTDNGEYEDDDERYEDDRDDDDRDDHEDEDDEGDDDDD